MDYAGSRAPFVMWFTGGSENMDHAITDDNMAAGISIGTGRYSALCGAMVCVSSMICPPGRRCASCEDAVLRVEDDSSSPVTSFVIRVRARGKHRDNYPDAPTVTERWFGRRKRLSRLTSRGSPEG